MNRHPVLFKVGESNKDAYVEEYFGMNKNDLKKEKSF